MAYSSFDLVDGSSEELRVTERDYGHLRGELADLQSDLVMWLKDRKPNASLDVGLTWEQLVADAADLLVNDTIRYSLGADERRALKMLEGS